MPIDYREYPEGWHTISWWVRNIRAQNYCEWCGAENGKPHPVTGSMVVLTVAHLNHVKHDVECYNLRALCQLCHLNYDRPRHIWRRRENKRRKRIESGQLELFQDQED